MSSLNTDSFYDNKIEEHVYIRKYIHLTRWLKNMPYYMRKHLIENIVILNNTPLNNTQLNNNDQTMTDDTIGQKIKREQIKAEMKMVHILEWLLNLQHEMSAEALFAMIYVLYENTNNTNNTNNILCYWVGYNALRIMSGDCSLRYST